MTAANEAQIVANLVILSRAADKSKAAMLIEGSKDGRLYRKVIDPKLCQPFAAGNRTSVELALQILRSSGEKGVLAVVDADTDHLSGKTSSDPDLLVTDTRDLEGILLSGTALQEVLVEFDLDGAFGAAPEVAATRSASRVALLKFAGEQLGWTVKTSKLDYSLFVDPTDLRCDDAKLCQHFKDLTITKSVTLGDIERELRRMHARGDDPFRVARGHDTTQLLAWAIAYRRGKKSKAGAKTTPDIVESYLRTAYSRRDFVKSNLFSQMSRWEAQNPPYKVLPG